MQLSRGCSVTNALEADVLGVRDPMHIVIADVAQQPAHLQLTLCRGLYLTDEALGYLAIYTVVGWEGEEGPYTLVTRLQVARQYISILYGNHLAHVAITTWLIKVQLPCQL